MKLQQHALPVHDRTIARVAIFELRPYPPHSSARRLDDQSRADKIPCNAFVSSPWPTARTHTRYCMVYLTCYYTSTTHTSLGHSKRRDRLLFLPLGLDDLESQIHTRCFRLRFQYIRQRADLANGSDSRGSSCFRSCNICFAPRKEFLGEASTIECRGVGVDTIGYDF